MSLDWNHFTPLPALAGGLLIGVAAALLLLFARRIAGISGIVGGLLRSTAGDRTWRVAFIAGLLAAAPVYGLIAEPLVVRMDAGWGTLLIAGLLVGIGTRYGAGCTSGHGVCGLSRLSLRSLVATAAFMASGFATVFLMRHVL